MTHPRPSFMKSFFFGQIREDLIFPFPRVDSELSGSLRTILEQVDRFGRERVRSMEWDAEGEMPREILNEVAALGLMGLAVPEDLGGLGLPQMAYARVVDQVTRLDGALSVTLGAHQSIGYKALLLFGTEEQKRRYLPRLAAGELIAAYCLTEPGSGSDAASIQSRATLSEDGRHYVLNGNKLWITNGGIASFLTIFAKTEVEGKDRVSCFILELPAEGVSVGPPEHKLGIRASWTNAIHFENVKIPIENAIGGVGQGFRIAMGVLNHGRLGLAAASVGGCKICIHAATEHANERVQFGRKIGEFGMIQEKIGRMMMNTYVAESIVYLTAGLVDRKDVDYSVESAIAKVFATEVVGECADENLQIWGGAGYMKEYPYERWTRDARINRIFEGTNEILRAFIALTAMQGPGEELAGLVEAIKSPLKSGSLKSLAPVGGYAFRRIKRTAVGRKVSGEGIRRAHPLLSSIAGFLEDGAAELASCVERLLRRHGKDILFEQFTQKRVADLAVDFYGLACVLSRLTGDLERKGPEACRIELSIADAFFLRASRRIRANFEAIERNDDGPMKVIARGAYENGAYPFDIF